MGNSHATGDHKAIYPRDGRTAHSVGCGDRHHVLLRRRGRDGHERHVPSAHARVWRRHVHRAVDDHRLPAGPRRDHTHLRLPEPTFQNKAHLHGGDVPLYSGHRVGPHGTELPMAALRLHRRGHGHRRCPALDVQRDTRAGTQEEHGTHDGSGLACDGDGTRRGTLARRLARRDLWLALDLRLPATAPAGGLRSGRAHHPAKPSCQARPF